MTEREAEEDWTNNWAITDYLQRDEVVLCDIKVSSFNYISQQLNQTPRKHTKRALQRLKKLIWRLTERAESVPGGGLIRSERPKMRTGCGGGEDEL